MLSVVRLEEFFWMPTGSGHALSHPRIRLKASFERKFRFLFLHFEASNHIVLDVGTFSLNQLQCMA